MDKPGYRFNTKFSDKDGATCDHRQPQSKRGDKFDYNNLAVCCTTCNTKKGNMSWIDWKKLNNISENHSQSDDSQEIYDIVSELKDDYAVETLVVDVLKNKKILITISGYFNTSELIETMESFSKDINNLFKRLKNFSKEILINNYSLDNYEYNVDGDQTELIDKFKIHISFYLNI